MSETAKKSRKQKPLGVILKGATTIIKIHSVYETIKIRGASVKNFDFEADYQMYAATVRGEVEKARKIAQRRLEAIDRAGAGKLSPEQFKTALGAYNKAYVAHCRKQGKLDFPRHLVKISRGVAYYSTEAGKVQSDTAAPPEAKKKSKPRAPQKPKVKRY